MSSPHPLVAWCQRTSESGRFQVAIILVILVNAALVGLETSAALVARHGHLFEVLNGIVLVIFLAELAIRITAYGWRVAAFLRDDWNLFDFVVVMASLVPGVGYRPERAR